MSKKLKKTRIYQEPNYTQKTGYVLADGGANNPTGKITFEELGKLLGSNPLIIVFMPDGSGSYTMYRQTTFDMNVQPQMEPIDFAWLYQNVYKVMVCAAIVFGTGEHNGNPIFFFSGMYGDPQTNQPTMEFTRFDTTEDEIVTEHSIIVSTDAQYPYTGGTTTITDRYVNISSGDNIFIFDASAQSSGEVTSSTTYAEVKAAWDSDKTILMRLQTTYGDHQIWPLIDVNYESDMFIFYFPGDEQQFDWQKPNYYQVIKTEIDKNFIYLWKGSSGNTDRYQRCNFRLNNLNNYVAKETGKGLSTNDYTNADKSTVTLAAEAIPSSASSSNMLTTVTDVEIIAGRTGGYKKVAKDQQGYPDVQNPSNKLIYLTQNDTQSGSNFYDEWLYDSAALTNWELIGSTQMDLTGYATEAWVNQHGFVESGELADYAKAADLQNLSDVVDSHADTIENLELDVSEVSAAVDEINSHLSDYATETWTAEEIDRATSGKMDASDSSAFYPMGSNPSGYLTQHQDLSEYAKTAEMNQAILSATSGKMDDSRASEFYPSNNPSGFIDETYLNGLATERWVNEHTSAFITSSYLDPYAKTEDLEALSDDLTDFTDEFTVKLDEVSGAVDQVIDTIGDISTEFDEKLEEKMDKNESSAFYPMDSNPAGYLVDEDLEEYATETYVDTGLGNTSAWAKATFASASQLDDYYPANNPSGFLTSDDVAQSDWTETDSADPAYIKNKPAALSMAAGEGIQIDESNNTITFSVSGDYAERSDLDDYYPKTNPSGFLTEVPAEYVTDTELQTALDDYGTSAWVLDQLDEKVDKETGMGLSHEDFTSAYKDKLDHIEASANKNVQADWTESDSASDAFIQHKPVQLSMAAGEGISITENDNTLTFSVSGDFATNDDLNYVSAHIPSLAGYATENYVQQETSGKVDKVTGKDLSTNDFTDALLDKLNAIEASAQRNVQSDWTETNSAAYSYIAHKPDPVTLSAGPNVSITEVGGQIVIGATVPDVSGKADKVSSATQGHLAALSSDGNLLDSTYSPASFATSAEMDAVESKIPANATPQNQLVTRSDLDAAATGAFDIVPLGANDQPDVPYPNGKTIYLTKDSSLQVTDPYTEWIWLSGTSAFEVIGETTIDLTDYATQNYVLSQTSGKVDKVTGMGLSHVDFTSAYQSKLDSIAPSAEVNVQSDWNVTNSALDSYIANKPDVIISQVGAGVTDVPKYIMVVTAMPPAAQIDPNTIYLVQGTYIGT